MNVLFSRLGLLAILLALILPATASAQIIGDTGTIGNTSAFIWEQYGWVTVYSYVKHSGVAGDLVGNFMGEVLKPDPMWYEGLGGIFSIGTSFRGYLENWYCFQRLKWRYFREISLLCPP